MDIKNDILPFIKPITKDENGKYNKKLYNLLKKMSNDQYQNRQFRVYFKPTSWWDGTEITFHKNIHKEVSSIIRQINLSPYGHKESGYSLMESLQKNKPERYSWIMHNPNKFIDITNWFFDTYIKMGRCMFDRNHYDFDNEHNQRYYIINKNHRKCRWCGEHFHREHHKKVEIRKYSTWEKS